MEGTRLTKGTLLPLTRSPARMKPSRRQDSGRGFFWSLTTIEIACEPGIECL